ncbi:MAG: GNAT family N-acetyltransferase [Desulfobacteraceae bacterium]|nr:GNAT family N-acetyltransferase [Desulfobacteraceae bacterium]
MNIRHPLEADHPTGNIPARLDNKKPGDTKVLFKKSNGDKIVIQKAAAKDAHALSDLIRLSYQDVAQTFNLTQDNCPKHPSNCTDDWIKKDMARGVKYSILYKDGIPIGCAGLEIAENNISYLERLAVLPEFRHKGLGEKLVEYMFSRARQMDSNTMSIGIIAEQEVLKKWYETLGFVYVETKKFDHLPFQVGFMKIEL